MFKNWLKNISVFFMHLNGTAPQDSFASLCKYIKPGDVDGLQYWTASLWYRSDTKPEDSWEDIELVIKRGGYCDCEEKACINVAVINTWTNCTARQRSRTCSGC